MAINLSTINAAALAGAIGATGSTGPVGSTGLQGPVGSTGLQGPIGSTGLVGSTGLTGSTGLQGPIGSTGLTGSTGLPGVVGATGIGYTVLTSATTQTISTGSKTFTVNTDTSQTAYPVGGRVRVYSNATPTNFMEGAITSYVTTTMIINFDFVNGTATSSDWRITLASNPGATGPKLVGTIGATGQAAPTSTVGYVNGDLWFRVS
jgi:uncharacterized protein YqfB (UPF0267 family)